MSVYVAGKKQFQTIQDAVIHARELAVNGATLDCIPLYDIAKGLVLAVVVKDFKVGLELHKLPSWPDDLECSYV